MNGRVRLMLLKKTAEIELHNVETSCGNVQAITCTVAKLTVFRTSKRAFYAYAIRLLGLSPDGPDGFLL